MAIRECSFDDIPTCMTRLVAETGGSITGGAAQVGRVFWTWESRSCTSCRASRRSVPCLKTSSMEDSWGTDFERRSSSPLIPFRACSRGTVTRDSTSEVESPRQAVCISTLGGANSGKASTGVFGSSMTPKNIIADAAATTRNRSLRLVPTIQRIMAGRLPTRPMEPVT
jgi:hypothetical protein